MRELILSEVPELKKIAVKNIEWFRKQLPSYAEYVQNLGQFGSLHLGQVGKDGSLEYYDGDLRVVDENGKVLVDRHDPVTMKKLSVKQWNRGLSSSFPITNRWVIPKVCIALVRWLV